MKNWLIGVIAALLIFTLAACKCDESCSHFDWKQRLVFSGFEDSSTSYVLVKRYTEGTGFTQLRDSTVYSDIRILSSETKEKEVYITLDDSSNYQIILPIGEALRMSNLVFGVGNCQECNKPKQYNRLNEADTYSIYDVENTNYDLVITKH
jgi:hypothetical protein